MDRSLARIALIAIPFLGLMFYALTRIMPPLTGYALGNILYWLGLLTLLLSRHDPATLRVWLTPRWPGPVIGALLVLPVAILLVIATLALREAPLTPLILLGLALGALCNGTLEELFWRRAILPEPRRNAVILAWTLFTGWHLALLTAAGVSITGGPLTLMAGAAVLGAIWMTSRLRTGTVGAGAISHICVNFLAYTELTVRNLT